MGIRGELFSTRFACDSRTYFFNVKQNRNGDVFLSIVESKPSEGESFDRRSIVVFGEQMEGFLKSFQAALKFIDKTGIKVDPDPMASNRSGDEEDERPCRSAEPRARRDSDNPRASSRSTAYRERSASDQRPARRAVVRSGPPSSRADSPAGRSSSGKPGAPTGRTFTASSRSAPPSGRSQDRERTGKSPYAGTGTRGADKPLKRIVVRKTKKPDQAD